MPQDLQLFLEVRSYNVVSNGRVEIYNGDQRVGYLSGWGECGEGGQWLFAPHKTVYSNKFCLMVLPCPLLERDLGSNPAKINIYFSCLACTPSPPTHNQALLAPPQAAST